MKKFAFAAALIAAPLSAQSSDPAAGVSEAQMSGLVELKCSLLCSGAL